ncbi:MAG: iron ABC transporter permease [Proteobacteria bacterium]|nr:iron ABC transporter permease [Pseudomonadota bacterium]
MNTSAHALSAPGMALPAARRRWPWSALLLALVMLWLVVVPFALMALSSVKPDGLVISEGYTLDHFRALTEDGQWGQIAWNTVCFVGGSVLLSVVLSLALAWLTERTDMPGRRLVRALLVLPMAMPPLLLAVAWILLASPRSGMLNQGITAVTGLPALFDIFTLPGMVFVQTLSMVPAAYLILMALVRRTNADMEDAARLSGAGFWRILFRITIPILSPGLIATALLLVIGGVATFDIPGAIGMPVGKFVVSSQVYAYVFQSVTGLPLYGQVGVVGSFIVLLTVPMVYVYQRATADSGRFVTVTGKGRGHSRTALGRWRWGALALVLGYFVLSTLLPLAVLLWVSLMPYQVGFSVEALSLLTLKNHAEVFGNPRIHQATVNTFLVSVLAATLVVALSVWLAYVVVRMRPRGHGALNFASFLPMAMPGVVLGVSLTYVYQLVSPGFMLGSVWILVIAFTTSYLTYGAQTMNSTLLQSSPVLEEAGQMCGASTVQVLRRVSLPLLMPAMIGVWIWVFSHGLRELTMALMLQSERNMTLAALLWGFWTMGNATGAAAVGIWLTVAMGILVLLWQLVMDRDKEA